MKIFTFALVVFSISALHAQTFTYKEIDLKNTETSKKNFSNKETESVKSYLYYQGKQVSIARQNLNGLPVHKSFIKNVTENKAPEFIQSYTVEAKNLKFSPTLEASNDFDLLPLIKQKFPEILKIEIIGKENVLLIENNLAATHTLIDFFDQTGQPFQAVLDQKRNLISLNRVGSHFSQITATVFAEGPKLSQLSEHLIAAANASPQLTNDFVRVGSESKAKINSLSENLKFDVLDDRFDQLQVFFYLNKSIQWMKDYLNVNLGRPIEAVVFLGYPDKTNSAFYYQNRIRLGKGDDVVYSNIPQDPSIVFHESFHALVDGMARLPFEGEGGSLNEAYADFLTALLLNRPYLAESSYLKGSYKRNLNTLTKLEEKNGGLYHDSIIVSGLLWEVKEKLGAEKAKLLALETLIKLNSQSKFVDFNNKVLEVVKLQFSLDDQLKLQAMLKNRGFLYE
jgi:Zn-dependent metalloprotease